MQEHDLISLTSWNAKQGPSFHHGTACSRIDHVFCRRQYSDEISKSTCYASAAPFLPLNGPIHVPMICSLPKPFVKFGTSSNHCAIRFQQKLRCRDSWKAQDALWHSFSEATVDCVAQMYEWEPTGCPIDRLHSQMIHCFQDHFPPQSHRPTDSTLPIPVRTKWQHHAKLIQLRSQPISPHMIFRFWFHVAQFKKHDRAQKKLSIQRKKDQIWESIRQADEASTRHDAFHCFNLFIT